MKGNYLLMNEKERRRLEVLSKLKSKEINLVEAAQIMNVSYRQAIRIKDNYFKEGDTGLVHKSRGRISNRSKPDVFKQKVLKRYRKKYYDFGPTFASEKLAEEGITVNPCTLWRWLIEGGDWKKRRTIKSYRKHRESREHFGELVQLDGSYHDWFKKRGEKATLMNMIDDATGINHSFLCDYETTENALKVLWVWIEKHGVPMCLYTDRKNIYCGLGNSGELTQFGKACKELGISIIYANSPQAKGKIERSNGVYQDRLVKELRLRNINTIGEANKFLQNEFIENLNKKFSVKPISNIDMHSKAPDYLELLKILSFREQRKVCNDWTIKWKNSILQIIYQQNLPKARTAIEVREYLDGSVHIFHGETELKFKEIRKRFSSNDNLERTVQETKMEYYQAMAFLKNSGSSIPEISKRLKVSENTIRSYIDRAGPPEGLSRKRTSKLAPYDKLIRAWLTEEKLIARDVHKRLIAMDFNGSRRNTEKYVEKIKAEGILSCIN